MGIHNVYSPRYFQIGANVYPSPKVYNDLAKSIKTAFAPIKSLNRQSLNLAGCMNIYESESHKSVSNRMNDIQAVAKMILKYMTKDLGTNGIESMEKNIITARICLGESHLESATYKVPVL